jgi:hypothetical protein
MALQPDDLLVQRAALALAHLISEPDNDEMKDLDRQTIRRCAAAAAGEANFRQLVIDCAQTWTTVTEEGMERVADRPEIEAVLRTVLDG